MKFFALDCHIGIKDIQTIFERLGHTLDIDSISGHTHLMGWERKVPNYINHTNWRKLSWATAHNFADFYREKLEEYDGFVCFYPPAFSMIYEGFDKPIIIQAPIRSDVPFENEDDQHASFFRFLKEGIDKQKIVPIANNRLDQEYNSILTDREWDLIPSLCDYTDKRHKKHSNDVLYYTRGRFGMMPKLSGLKQIDELGGKVSWEELYGFRALVHIPYCNSTMSIFEQYSANVPMMFPSLRFLSQLRARFPHHIMNELSWRQIRRLPPQERTQFKERGIPDLDDYGNLSVTNYWYGLSDFYDKKWFPDIIHYDSFEHLQHIIQTHDFEETHQEMLEVSDNRREEIIGKWEAVLEKIA